MHHVAADNRQLLITTRILEDNIIDQPSCMYTHTLQLQYSAVLYNAGFITTQAWLGSQIRIENQKKRFFMKIKMDIDYAVLVDDNCFT